MNPLPLPVRIAAGLVATAVEQVRDLPRLVVEFPVTAISHTLQASMRMQQKVTELAIKGDRALRGLWPADEAPTWATFDDEEPPARNGDRNGASTVTALRPQPNRPAPPRRRPKPAVDDPPTTTAAEVADQTPAAGAQPADTGPGADDASGPTVLPGYRDMTIPQLRGRLRKLSERDLRALLAWETAHDDRPPFVTILSNRITTVTEG
jgi:hypothetical protein